MKQLGSDALDLPQQQRAGVRGDVPAVETSHHRAPLNRFKFEQLRRTSVGIGAAPWIVEISLPHNDYLKFQPRCTCRV